MQVTVKMPRYASPKLVILGLETVTGYLMLISQTAMATLSTTSLRSSSAALDIVQLIT